MTIHEFDPVIYPVKLWVILDPSVEEINEQFKPRYKNDKFLDEIDEDGIMYTSVLVEKKDNLDYGILVLVCRPKILTVGGMAHEACHIVDEVYNYINEFKIDFGCETNAYFVQWVTNSINEAIKYKDKKKK